MISAFIANLLPCFIYSSTGQILVSVDCLHTQELGLQWMDRFIADYSIGTQSGCRRIQERGVEGSEASTESKFIVILVIG